MKKILISLVSILASCCFSFATAVTKSVELGYKQSSFSFTYDSSGYLQIIPQDGIYAYDEKTDNPGLPYFSVAVYVPDGQLYQNCNLTFSRSLLYDNCVLAPTPILQPTSCISASETPRKASYVDATYPKNNVIYAGECTVGDSKIIYFKICPFVYDNSNKKLYFAESAKLDITFQKSANIRNSSSNITIGPGMAEQLTRLVVNPEDFLLNTNPDVSMPSDIPSLSYVIITSKALENSFIPLRNWKRQKGVWTDILTVESIEQTYEGKSLQEKIKRCLYDLHTKRGLSYVLLGGDDTVVPVRYCANTCYMPNNSIIPIPTDLYYSCFGKTFDWDYNGNGIYGEPGDSIGLMPSIFLSRLPIRSADEVKIYSDRLISYETMKNPDQWNKKMLFCGCKLSDNIGINHSDAEKMGDDLYNQSISPYWNGERKRLYDTCNDFGYNGVNRAEVQEQLSTGYAFADFIAHGAPFCYNLKAGGYYDKDLASQLTNNGYTLITSTACCTNAFDDCDLEGGYGDPCLSESFIRNEKSGVIAYLGCSREGFHYSGKADGPTLQYEKRFYKNLFSGKFVNNNFAKIVACSKADFISLCSYNDYHRWIQFCLNPIGDAEMPVFTDTPKKLPSVKVEIKNDNLYVKTGVDSCTVCVMSRLDNGRSYYKVFHNASDVCFTNIVDSMSLCITKPNYIPQVINDVRTYNMLTHPIGGTIIGVGKGLTDNDLVIKYHIANNDSKAKIVVSPYDGSPSISVPVSAEDDALRLNAQQFKKGVLGISLIVNSKLADSINIENK